MVKNKLLQNKIKKKSIAIIGSGISGLSSTLLLSKKYNVSLYEKNDYLGGHAYTKSSYLKSENGKKAKFNYDVGFLVYNEKNYPYFTKLLNSLKVKTISSNMSFSVTNKSSSFEYGSTGIKALTNNFKNIFCKKYWTLLIEIIRFYKLSKKELNLKLHKDTSVRDFLIKHQFNTVFINEHFLPMCGAIWSTPKNKVLSMPVVFVINFFNNHGLLNYINRPKWRTIKNGSKFYVKEIEKTIEGKIYRNEKVIKVFRNNKKVRVVSKNFTKYYDKIIFAIHADKILSIINKPTKLEINIFSKLKYQTNKIYVHQDRSLMPSNKNVWSAWNAIVYDPITERSSNENICVTYWLNKLQNLQTKEPLFVTLNPPKDLLPKKTKIKEVLKLSHPVFDFSSLIIKPKLLSIQGRNNTFFVGAWQGNGFHEDGLKSAIDVAKAFDIKFIYE